MNKTALVVAAAEGFIIKGLMAKLKGIDILAQYAPPAINELKKTCGEANLIIIYTDDSIFKTADALVYIKDHCAETDKQVMVIGTKEEYGILRNYIPDGFLYKFFERPLDMEKLLDECEQYMNAESQYARRKSILVVDDDVSYMSMISDWLKDTYRVSMANSGMEAIMWLSKNHTDLILLDYEMPITTGPQVLEMIRSNAALSGLPVMFLTGKSDKESIMKVLALKPVGYLLKNVDRKGLHENIAKFFATQEKM